MIALGTISTEFRCAIRKSGIEVDDSKCFDIPTPPGKKEKCDAGSCSGKPKSVVHIFRIHLQVICWCKNLCRFFWSRKKWTSCSVTCGTGFQSRRIVCRNGNTSTKVDFKNCQSLTRPETSRTCILKSTCVDTTTPTTTPTPVVGDWIVGDWSDCSATCGNGQQTRTVTCSSATCPDPKPASNQTCKLTDCSSKTFTDSTVRVW